MDKRQVYDWDTRIHLLARGPGIKKGGTFDLPATQVDIAPTFLGLAGLKPPPTLDGKSLLPLLLNPGTVEKQVLLSATETHLSQLPPRNEYAASWRKAVFIEYYYNSGNDKCMQNCTAGHYPQQDTWCGDLTPGSNAECWGKYCDLNCYPTESVANNYIGLRTVMGEDTLYAIYQTGEQSRVDINFSNFDYVEYYDVAKDPWQMHNAINTSVGKAAATAKHAELMKWFQCAGESCP